VHHRRNCIPHPNLHEHDFRLERLAVSAFHGGSSPHRRHLRIPFADPDVFPNEHDRPASAAAISHLEFYYGFLGVTLLWQCIFVLIACDPLRFQAIIPIAVLEKVASISSVRLLGENRPRP